MTSRRVPLIAHWTERLSFMLAVICLGAALVALVQGVRYQMAARQALSNARTVQSTPAASTPEAAPEVAMPEGFLGELVIPRLNFSVAVLEGEDARSLRLGIGHLTDTPLPWEGGNTALAAHRDTFFRPLANVRVGDAIELQTVRGTFAYRVKRVFVVHPEEVWVVGPQAGAALTLVTCYPFNLVGPAPDRWIVQAVPADYSAASGDPSRVPPENTPIADQTRRPPVARNLQ